LNWTAIAIVIASVTSVKPSVSCLTSLARARRSASPPGADRPGVSATAMAPTSGIAPMTVSHGNVLI
jgi:hypothetical protein